MLQIVDRILVFHASGGKRFIADDVKQIVVKNGASKYNSDYSVRLHDGEELEISERQVIDAYDKPEYVYVPIVESDEWQENVERLKWRGGAKETTMNETKNLKGDVSPLASIDLLDAALPPYSDGEQISETVYYGGRGKGGEYYSKDFGNDESESIWTMEKNIQRWTPEDLELIASHLRRMRKQESI